MGPKRVTFRQALPQRERERDRDREERARARERERERQRASEERKGKETRPHTVETFEPLSTKPPSSLVVDQDAEMAYVPSDPGERVCWVSHDRPRRCRPIE